MKRDRLPKEQPFEPPALHKAKSIQQLEQGVDNMISYIQDRAEFKEAKQYFTMLEEAYHQETQIKRKTIFVKAFADLVQSPAVLQKHPGLVRRSLDALAKGLETTFDDYGEENLYSTHLGIIINNKDITEKYPHYAQQGMVSLTNYARSDMVMNKEGILDSVQEALRNETFADHFRNK